MDKLTTKSQEAIAAAIQAASSAGNPQLEPVHLLVALLEQPGGVAGALVDAVGANRAAISQRAQAAVAALPGASGSSVTQPTTSRSMMNVITHAGEEATALGDEYVSTEHLLMAVARSESTAGEILRELGAGRDILAGALPAVRGRSEEHTSELQSRGHLVCRLLLEKKKRRPHTTCVIP